MWQMSSDLVSLDLGCAPKVEFRTKGHKRSSVELFGEVINECMVMFQLTPCT